MDYLKEIFDTNKPIIYLKDLEIYKTLFTHITDIMFISDLNGNITDANVPMETVTGYKKEEIRKQPFLQLIAKKERFKLSSALKKLKQGEPQNNIYSIKHKKRRMIELNLSLIPIQQQNKIIGVIGIGKDMTKVKKQERELIEIKENLNRAQMIGNIGSWDYDVIEDEGYWSKQLFHIFGIAEDSPFVPTYTSVLSLIYFEDRDRFIDAFHRSLKEGLSLQMEVRIKRADGDIRIISIHGDVILDENGHPVRLIGTIQDITDQKLIEEKMNYLSHHDHLTDVPNRRMFDETLDNTMVCAKEKSERFAVFYLNLDRFKNINDTLGHLIGDELLKEVSSRLVELVPGESVVARMAGDEFAIILPDVRSRNQGENLAEIILRVIEETFYIKGYELYMTASIGISFFPEHGDTVDVLMNNTIAAQNRAKQLGKNNFQFCRSSLEGEGFKAYSIENGMRKALSNNEFEVHYQPRVCTNTGKILSAEALIRWNHPEFGFIPPIDFIPLAEENGLIFEISDWVAKCVCIQLKEWQEENIDVRPISINISAQGFLKNDVVPNIKSTLSETCVDPSLIELEITESSYINNMEMVIQDLAELRKMGIKIALDDFGTGFSSLTHLKDLNIDTLKIDRSFIKDITEKKHHEVITSSVIQLAHGLNIEVVAEGVETVEQLELLKQKGCDQIQGFLFSKPVPALEFKGLLKKGSIDIKVIN